jgi:hypothetical protein
MDIEKLKYPLGLFVMPDQVTENHLQKWIRGIAEFPAGVESAVRGLDGRQLSMRYRPGGWTIRQVVHHCGDSHLNALARFKFALTENNPEIKPYPEHLWAELADANTDSLDHTLSLLRGVHGRWVTLMNAMRGADWDRGYFHPEKQRLVSLREAAGSYEWHCRHHLAHVRLALVQSY